MKIIILLSALFSFNAFSNEVTGDWLSITSTLNCTGINQEISLQLVMTELSTQIIYAGQELDCLSTEMQGNDIVCTAINFETAGAVIVKLTPELNATLDILPGPGNGIIEHFDLTCNSIK